MASRKHESVGMTLVSRYCPFQAEVPGRPARGRARKARSPHYFSDSGVKFASLVSAGATTVQVPRK
jgi:hypothetical protein